LRVLRGPKHDTIVHDKLITVTLITGLKSNHI